jgi:hypothetical protein
MKQKYLLLSMIIFAFLFSATSFSVLAVTPNLELTPPTQSVTVGSQANIAEYDSVYSTLLFPLATGWELFLQQ